MDSSSTPDHDTQLSTLIEGTKKTYRNAEELFQEAHATSDVPAAIVVIVAFISIVK
jgi:hypothetical protein